MRGFGADFRTLSSCRDPQAVLKCSYGSDGVTWGGAMVLSVRAAQNETQTGFQAGRAAVGDRAEVSRLRGAQSRHGLAAGGAWLVHLILRVRFEEALPTPLNQHRHHALLTCLARTTALRRGANLPSDIHPILIVQILHKLAITARWRGRRRGPRRWRRGAWRRWGGARRRGPPRRRWRHTARVKGAAGYPRGRVVGLREEKTRKLGPCVLLPCASGCS